MKFIRTQRTIQGFTNINTYIIYNIYNINYIYYIYIYIYIYPCVLYIYIYNI